ncbi:hypothetical protein, partial [Microbacterium testaceum]|uniref:hypothetical protein n=1 Tax=Microbacterium testaceum TaxID=2033 RepID=UPI001D17A324
QLRQLKTGAFLENASITNGRLRIIGGLLLVDSGGTLQVIGHLAGNGDFVWSGPWAFTGEGEITGDVALTGNLEVLDDGTIKVGNIELRDGKVFVGTGASQIVIDGDTGKILAGDVEIELDQITVGGGDSPATLKDGALGFETGGKVEADTTNNGIRMTVGGAQVYVGTGGAALQFGTRTLIITAGGFNFLNLDTIPQSLTVDENPINSMYVDATTGRPYRVVAG